jgi:GR25 family glycosyltransferase involved in LPS biosynthesis
MSNKLEGFGPIYVLNLERSPERRAQMLAEFEKHGITDFSFISAIDGTKDFQLQGVNIQQNKNIRPVENACAASHLLALEHWLSTNDSLYAIFFEDDISFELIEKWKFSWEEIIQQVPDVFDTLQMCPIRTHWESDHIGLRLRDIGNDWGAGAYVIHREYAQHLLSKHLQMNTFINMDVSENILFSSPNAYVYTLFVENATNETTMVGRENHAGVHTNSRNKVLEFYL